MPAAAGVEWSRALAPNQGLFYRGRGGAIYVIINTVCYLCLFNFYAFVVSIMCARSALGGEGPNWEQFQSAQVPSQFAPRFVLVSIWKDVHAVVVCYTLECTLGTPSDVTDSDIVVLLLCSGNVNITIPEMKRQEQRRVRMTLNTELVQFVQENLSHFSS